MKMRVLLFSLLVGAAFAQNCPDNAADALKENVRALTGAALGSAKANSVRIKKIKVEFESDARTAHMKKTVRDFFNLIWRPGCGERMYDGERDSSCTMNTPADFDAVKALIADEPTKYHSDNAPAITNIAGALAMVEFYRMLNDEHLWGVILGEVMTSGDYAAMYYHGWGTWGTDKGETFDLSGRPELAGLPLLGALPPGIEWEGRHMATFKFNTEGKIEEMNSSWDAKSIWDTVKLTERFQVLESNSNALMANADHNPMYDGPVSVSTRFYLNVSRCKGASNADRFEAKYFTQEDCDAANGSWEPCNDGSSWPQEFEPLGFLVGNGASNLGSKECGTVATINQFLAEEKSWVGGIPGTLYSFRVWGGGNATRDPHTYGTWIRIFENRAAWEAYESSTAVNVKDCLRQAMCVAGGAGGCTEHDCGSAQWNNHLAAFGAKGYFDMSEDPTRGFIHEPADFGPIVVE